jgi:hypothetical protein
MSPLDPFLTLDIAAADPAKPLTASVDLDGDGVGALALVVERADVGTLALREDFPPEGLQKLVDLADAQDRPLGEYLLSLPGSSNFGDERYRHELEQRLGQSLPVEEIAYIFWPVPLDGGEVGMIAARGGPLSEMHSMNQAYGCAAEACDQLRYFAECLLGSMHNIDVTDLLVGYDKKPWWTAQLRHKYAAMANEEKALFIRATGAKFGGGSPGVEL